MRKALWMLRTLLVPYDGSASADDVLHLACNAVSGATGRVVVLYVARISLVDPQPSMQRPGDGDGFRALDHAQQITRQYGGMVETRLVRARSVVTAIVTDADAIRADGIFLVLGPGCLGQRWRHAWMAWQVMRRAHCPVLLT